MTIITAENIKKEFLRQPSCIFVNNVNRELQKKKNSEEIFIYNLFIGHAHLNQRKYNYAHYFLDLALKQKETDEAYFLKGEAFYFQGDDTEAIKYYSKAIEINPNHDKACYSIGNIHYLNNENDKARNWFEKTIALNPNHHDANLNLGNVYVKIGQPKDGVKLKFKYDSKDIEEILIMGQAYWQKGDEDSSLRYLKNGLELELDDKKEAQLLKGLGIKTFIKRYGSNPDLAIEYLEKALKLDDSDAQIHGALALIFTKKNDLARAKGHFEKSFEIEPNHARRLYNYSLFLLQDGKSELALEVLQKSQELNPYDKDVCFQLGSFYMQQSSDTKAENLLILAEQLGHQSAQKVRLEKYAKIASDYMKEGNLQFQQRQYQNAIESFQKATELFENYVEFKGDTTYSNITSCLNNIGYSMTLLKDPKGENYLKQAIERDSLYLDAHNNLGNLYLQLKQPQKALKQFNKVKQLDKNFGSSYYNSGKVYLEQLNEYDKAIEELDIAIRIYIALGTDQQVNDAYYLKGKCNEALENYGEAKENYFQAYADGDVDRIERIINGD